MGHIILQPTAVAEWHTLVNEAECMCGNYLAEDIENYLVWLLLRYTDHGDALSKSLASQYLQSHTSRSMQQENLRDVGDICLILAGLFPERAVKLLVPITYFIELGRRAYNDLSVLLQSTHSQDALAQLYLELQQNFVELIETLHCMRELAGDDYELSLLQAEELWQYARSQHAMKIIRKHTKGILIYSELKERKFH
jgi:hypothetical protein